MLKGISIVKIKVFSNQKTGAYSAIMLEKAFYIPKIDINLVLGIYYYKTRGILIKETFYSANQ